MADARVQSAIDNWGPRLIANGVDYNDFVRTTASISRWEEWLDAWSATADMHRELAEQALSSGPLAAARARRSLRAAVSYHFAKFVWVLDLDRNHAATEAAARSLYEAHALLDPTAERDAGAARWRWRGRQPAPAGHGRRARAARAADPRAGLDQGGVLRRWESVFLDRGMATFSLDGPGQGETGFHSHIRPDYEVAVTAALDALAGRPELDLGRVGAAGMSLGGYYAVRAAAFEPRLKAIAGVSGAYDMSAAWDTKPSLTREAFASYSGAERCRRHASALPSSTSAVSPRSSSSRVWS